MLIPRSMDQGTQQILVLQYLGDQLLLLAVVGRYRIFAISRHSFIVLSRGSITGRRKGSRKKLSSSRKKAQWAEKTRKSTRKNCSTDEYSAFSVLTSDVVTPCWMPMSHTDPYSPSVRPGIGRLFGCDPYVMASGMHVPQSIGQYWPEWDTKQAGIFLCHCSTSAATKTSRDRRDGCQAQETACPQHFGS